MNRLVLHQRRCPLDRSIYSAHVATAEELIRLLRSPELSGEHFVLFLAWDAGATADETILAFAREIIRAGLSYIVTWGPGCERVHDLFDDAATLENPEAVLMSTWHEHEPLEEALWFAVNSAYPSAPYEATTATIAVVVANEQWAKAVEAYLSTSHNSTPL